MLERLGYAVLEADSAGTAIALIERGPPPTALIADIRMPEIPGTRLAWMARAYVPGLPVLFMSAFPAENPVPEDLPSRAAFLMKPFTQEELSTALHQLLG